MSPIPNRFLRLSTELAGTSPGAGRSRSAVTRRLMTWAAAAGLVLCTVTPSTTLAQAPVAEDALAALSRSAEMGEALDPVVRMDLLYHVATEEEAWVDSLQTAVEAGLAQARETGTDSLVVSGYLGALEVLRAKHGTWPPSRIKWVRRGVERLDVLVEQRPTDVHVLYLRTVSTLFLPSIMGREEQATRDLESLALLLVEEPTSAADLNPAIQDRITGFVLEYGDRLDPAVLYKLQAIPGPVEPSVGAPGV